MGYIVRAIKNSTQRRGVDLVVVSSSHNLPFPDLLLSIECLRRGGTIVMSQPWVGHRADSSLSRQSMSQETLSKVHSGLLEKELRFLNSEGFTSATFERTLRWIEGGLLFMMRGSVPIMQPVPLSGFAAAHQHHRKEQHGWWLLYPDLDAYNVSEEDHALAKKRRTG
jgi:hypothetical protein